MKLLLLSIAFLINQLIYSQDYSAKDIIGVWEVNKCEMFINGDLIKTAYINNYGDYNKVVEGKSAGINDQKVVSIIKSVLGSSLTFNEDSTVYWDQTIPEFDFNISFWFLENTGELFISESKNNLKLNPVLKGRILEIINDEVRIDFFKSGIEGRLILLKK
jgi:hypothetical protein